MTDFESRVNCDLVEVPEMTFSSSPVAYPPSSSPAPPPAAKQKRKLFQTLDTQQPVLKKPRIVATAEGTVQIVEDSPEVDLSTANTGFPEIRPEPQDQPYLSPSAKNKDYAEPEKPVGEPPSSLPPCFGRGLTRRTVEIQTTSGKSLRIPPRIKQAAQTYEQVIADRSTTAEGRAKRAYYGLEIHQLIDDAKTQHELDSAAKELRLQREAEVQPSIERPQSSHSENGKRSTKHQMWTEKYRAKKFTELVGDERTHRSVLKWLKAWDSIVFPGTTKPKTKKVYEDKDIAQEYQHRKILLLTGPPGLGKTTLAHVCAKQAGYGVLEINASDDRSRDVVKGRIKDALGTETVRGIQEPGKTRRAGRPVCVVVDEVDGVVTGSGGSGGEGGFMKALIDLVQLDQKNASQAISQTSTAAGKRKGDRFKLLRPLILICNDVYAPALRPLRSSNLAEIVHVRKPPIDKVITRMKTVFEKENIRCDNDAIRRLCEDCWGLGSRKQSSKGAKGSGDGDIRGVLVQGEWMAHKLRQDCDNGRLTRKWVELQIGELSTSKGQKGLGRGGVREVVERVFIEGAGMPNLPTTLSADEARQVRESKSTALSVSDLRKRSAITALREMVDMCGDHDRLMTDCFQTYPTQTFQDDTFLSKPNTSYDWLHFHNSLSSRIFSGQEWERNPYLSTGACAFHNMFAGISNGTSAWENTAEKQETEEQSHPFSGVRADFAAYEAEKQTKTVLTEMQGTFSAELLRLFSSPDVIATELIPNVSRILCPDVKPVVVGGSGGGPAVASVRRESERNCVQNSVRVMNALNIAFEKVRIENEGYGSGSGSGGFAFRMEPPIDTLSSYHFTPAAGKAKTSTSSTQPTRYAIRQVLDQELRKEKVLQASNARQARGHGAALPTASVTDGVIDKENLDPSETEQKIVKIERDFFGRPTGSTVVSAPALPIVIGQKVDASTIAKSTATKGKARDGKDGGRIWVSFQEGFSNAVRKPITMSDLMDGF